MHSAVIVTNITIAVVYYFLLVDCCALSTNRIFLLHKTTIVLVNIKTHDTPNLS